MPYVYSTASTDQGYPKYSEAVDDGALPQIIHEVIVKGGANVADKRFVTPYGVCTEVSEEDFAFLATDPNFLKHMKAGFVRLEARRHDPEVVAADMKSRDRSAPLVPADFTDGKAPKVGVAA